MTIILDASVVVAALIDDGPTGRWAEEVLLRDHLAAPHLMPVEVAHVLRQGVQRGRIPEDRAAVAHAELQALPVDLFSYGPVASRVWHLRENVRPYDGWYVALAELLDADLATLDARLARAPGIECTVVTPPV